MVEPFPLIEISGPPRERGRQYGRQAAERIRKGTSHYHAQLKELSLDSAGVSALVRDYLPVIEAFEPAYVEEMHGIEVGDAIVAGNWFSLPMTLDVTMKGHGRVKMVEIDRKSVV